MIVDTSALIAVLKDEPEAEVLANALADARRSGMSAASYLEAGIVVDRSGDPSLSRELDRLIERVGVGIEPVTETQARIARVAYRDFGKGSGHRARLNFGDCFAYALAIDVGEPLLCKGDDFVHTDAEVVPLT